MGIQFQIDASFIVSILALVFGGYASITSFFGKRELASNDKVKEVSYKNAEEIQVMNTKIERMEADIEKANAKADGIVSNYKASFREVNTKLDDMAKGISLIQVSCAGHLAREGMRINEGN